MALLLNRVKFTEDVDAALSAKMPTEKLRSVQSAVVAKRNAGITAVRGDLDKAAKRQYHSLLTLFNEQLQLLEELISAENPKEVWAAELRLYANSDGTVCCRSGAHELLVGDDFPANNMLVCTPLTRKARTNIIEALMTGKIYLATGPAGTGKTETVKDTFRTLGMNAVVVSCTTDQVGEAPKEGIETALASGGTKCPVIFDEFNHVRADAMEAVADGTAGSTFCCLTFNGLSSAVLPEALQARILETPMMVPDYEQIVQVMLSTEGFMQCDELSKKLLAVCYACKDKMSKACHYDFGMRFQKAMVRTSGALARSKGFEDETQSVADALGLALFMRSTPEDRSIALEQVKQALGVEASIPAAFEASAPAEARLAAMVSTVARTRHGVGVVGTPDVESTVAAIDAVMGSESLIVRDAPEALFGEQGAFTQAFRAAVQKDSPVNIVLVTPLESHTLEPLMTVLDDNKILVTGTDGARIKMTPHMRVVLIQKDFEFATPALVSRLGMVLAA